jgi:hypothetical protein
MGHDAIGVLNMDDMGVVRIGRGAGRVSWQE